MIAFVKRIFVYPIRYFMISNSTKGPQYINIPSESDETTSTKRKLAVAIIVIFLCLALFINTYVQPVRFIFVHQNTNSTCHLPDINPFDESIMQFIWHPKSIMCDPSPSVVYIDPDGNLQINTTLAKSTMSSIDCFYRIIKRSGDNDVTMLPEVKFRVPVYIPSDYVKVTCYIKNKVVYDRVLFNVDYKSIKKSRKIHSETESHLSVLIFGLDSVSRLAAERKLVKTMDFIKNTLNGYVLKGFTSVGGSTYPNLIPSLTGKTAYSDELPVDPRKEYTDSYPFIWKEFAQEGYVTMFSEDFPEISLFNYMLKGFKKSPVDHYLRPYYIARNNMNKADWNINQVLMYLEDKRLKFGKYSSLCYGNRSKHGTHIDHYKKFVSTYKGLRKFGFSWLTEICHDYMNFLELADDDILEMLKTLYNHGNLNNSIFILLGDHGPRTDEIRNTPIGRIEERMPLLSIVIPEHLKQKYPHIHKNLKENENRLTSPYDLHETYMDVVKQTFKPPDEVKTRPYPRGISLFRNIPKDRSCTDASIAEHFCACYTAKQIPVNNHIKSISHFIVNSINIELAQFKDKCSNLTLNSIKAAQQIETGLQYKEKFSRKTLLNLFYKPKSDFEQRYLVLIETIPGHALFEATVSSREDNKFRLLGDVSRTNRYNNQSHCISHKNFKHKCYCKDQV